jgi:AraC-like DNA-binding protein
MKCTCLAIIKQENLYKIRPYLDDEINLITRRNVRETIIQLRTKNISCTIFFMNKETIHEKEKFFLIKKKFPTIPLISIFTDRCIETAREFGEAGIDKVLHYSDIDRLNKEVVKLIHQHTIKITLKDIGITKLKYSEKLNEALCILEKNYISLKGVKEIADLLEINECTLSREFKKYNLPGSKRILMYLKVHHAVRLMENSGLNKKEVAVLSGFSNEKRLAECLRRML